MPLIELVTTRPEVPDGLLPEVSASAAEALGIDAGKAWVIWRPVEPAHFQGETHGVDPAAAIISCRRSHPRERILRAAEAVRRVLAAALWIDAAQVFVQIRRVDDEEVLELE